MGAGILDALFLAGLTARVEAGRLVVSPADRITPALRQMIQISKAAILAAIQDREPHRRWSIRTLDGRTWDVTQTPPATAAEMARSYPPGSVLEPMPEQSRPPACPALPAAVETRIRRWLDSIGEVDTAIIGEVLSRCRHDPGVSAMYLTLAGDVPGGDPGTPTTCGTCTHYRRTSHPRLGHCQAGEPEPAAGFWDSDLRSCPVWKPS